MKLDELLDMWEKDSVLDDLNLDEETKKCPLLHSKYIRIFGMAKMKLKKYEQDYEYLKKDKWLYYNGKMTKEQIEEKNWPYDPFKGCSKPLKTDLDRYYNTDDDLVKVKAKIDYIKIFLEVLEDILGQIRFRGNSIKNAIEFKKFVNGN